MKKLFLDDIRSVEMVYDKSMVPESQPVRTYEGFVQFFLKNGLPDFSDYKLG